MKFNENMYRNIFTAFLIIAAVIGKMAAIPDSSEVAARQEKPVNLRELANRVEALEKQAHLHTNTPPAETLEDCLFREL